MRFQQDLPRFAIGIVLIDTFDTRLSFLRTLIPLLTEAIHNVAAGTVVIIDRT